MDSGVSSETSLEILRSVHRSNSGPTTTHHGVVAFHPPASQPKTHPHMLNVSQLDQKKEPESVGTSFPKISWMMFVFPKVCFFPTIFGMKLLDDIIPSYQKCDFCVCVCEKATSL